MPINDFPTENQGVDVAHALVRGAISELPLLSGPGLELWNLVVTPPLQRRQIRWLNSVAGKLNYLEENLDGFDIESLINNDLFLSTLLSLTQTVLKTHEYEKIVALRNYVINIAIGTDIEEDKHLILIGIVDRFTASHIKVLTVFKNPGHFETRITSALTIMQQLKAILTDFNEEFIEIIVHDLESMNLIQQTQLRDMMTNPGTLQPRTTDLGESLISMISEHEG